jgi:tetratricopeptide (TPR) repeat protein
MDADWNLNTLRRVAQMPIEDRVAYRSATTMNEQAEALNARGKYAEAQRLFEKVLQIRRRLLTDDHPLTASSLDNLATNLDAEGKSGEAQPLHEKALEILRRLLTDNHPNTATSYNNLGLNLNDQGKHAEALIFLEKALEIRQRLFHDNHPDTAHSYNNVAISLKAQEKYTQAQPLYEKALEISRRLLTDNHPQTAQSYNNLASNLSAQGKYVQAQAIHEKTLKIRRSLLTDERTATAESYNNLSFSLAAHGKYTQAQPLLEKALEINRRLLTDEYPHTAASQSNLAAYLNAQGKFLEARDRWLASIASSDSARLRIAFTGLERAGAEQSVRRALAAVLARLGQRAEAWQRLEEDFGRGLLDELAARKDQRLAPEELGRLQELIAALARIDRLMEMTPEGLEQPDRARTFAELRHERELASIALGEFQTKLVQSHSTLAGRVASLDQIQAALSVDVALIAWVDIPPLGPNAADPDGEHWCVVLRSRGIPARVPIAGSGSDGLRTKDDSELAARIRTELRKLPGDHPANLRPVLDQLRAQRLEPLTKALGAPADGQPTARRLVVLPSRAMAGIPVEVLLAPDDTRTVSYAPDPNRFTRPARASLERQASLRRPALCPRDPARLETEGRASHTLGMRHRPRP